VATPRTEDGHKQVT